MFPVVPAGGRKPRSLPAFIVAGNGIFLRKESALGITQTRVDSVAHLPHLAPSLEYRLPPIPKKLSAQIAGFLLKVDQKYHCEGALLLCLDKRMRWKIVVPRQDPSGADVKYFVDEDTVPDGWLLAGTVHSHPFSTTPTASWTDENDERKIDGVHLVAGSLKKNPQYGAAVVVNGTRFKYANWQDLIVPAEPDVNTVPDEWFDKIEKKKSNVISKVVGAVTSYGSSYTYVPDYLPKEGETVEQAIARARKGSFDWINESLGKLGYRLVWSVEELPEGATAVEDDSTASKVPDTVLVGQDGKQTPVNLAVRQDVCECNVCECGLLGQLYQVGDALVCGFCRDGNHATAKKPKKAKVKDGMVDTPSGPMKVSPITPSEDRSAYYTSCPEPTCQHMRSNHDSIGCVVSDCECRRSRSELLPVVQQEALLPIEQEPTKWRNAKPIVCLDKHPTKACPINAKTGKPNCGCHCEPCRTHMVGAYDAADVEGIPTEDDFDNDWFMGREPQEDECKCEKCYQGCYAYLGKDYKETNKTLCNDCERGGHYLVDGSIAYPDDQGMYIE